MKLVSDQVNVAELTVIMRELQAVLSHGVSGAVVEFGCYVGTTSLFLQEALEAEAKGRELHVYDSFEGLPEKRSQDSSPVGTQFQAGELLAKKSKLIKNFHQAHLPLPYIHKGWFSDLTSNDIPSQISFAFLDGDYYQSILDSLKLIWPRLVSGAVVVLDDYQNEQLPGVQKAAQTWSQHHRFTVRSQASLAIISV